MCGIAGLIDFNHRDIDTSVLNDMLDKLIHRGPDEAGCFVHNHVALGIRRLKVIALENGSQPCFSNDKRYIIVFNGEIYNFKILRERLKSFGYRFKTDSDAEVIVNLYQHYGQCFCDYLEGMFAIAIYDSLQDELLLARDAVGKKPLFYANRSNRLCFSSELEPLFCDRTIPRSVNYTVLDYYLRFRVVPSDETIFDVVHKVPPGTIIRFNHAGITVHRYWEVEYYEDISARSVDEWVDELDKCLTTAVETRLEAEVPVGTMLSGGLDSSLITAIACRLKPEQMHTFSIGFNESKYNELEYARALSRDLGTFHKDYIITERPALDAADKLIAHFGEPFAFPSSIASFFMYQQAAEDVTVVLGGDGADEIFGGYSRYQLVQRFPDRLNLADLPRQVDLPYESLHDHIFASFYQGLLTDGLSASLRTVLYSPTLVERLEFSGANEIMRKRFSVLNTDQNPLSAAMKFDFNHWMPEAQLVKVDIASMANSLEVRAPFLDKSVVQLGTSLPNALKLHPEKEKYLLHRVAQRYLPAYILNRKKQELAVPIDLWLVSSMRDDIVRTVTSEEALSRGYFDPDALLSFTQQVDHTNSYALWTLYMLEKWHQTLAF